MSQFKTLVGKEWKAFISSYTIDPKTGLKKSKGKLALALVLVVYVVGVLGYQYGMLASALAPVFHMLDMGRQYYTLLLLNAFSLSFIFTTLIGYSILFEAKDNELLLAMPIKPSNIIVTRMISCYLFSMFFVLMSLTPAYLFWTKAAGFEFSALLRFIGVLVMTPVASLVLSNVCGYLIAFIASKARNRNKVKTLLTVFMTILYSVGYSTIMSNQATIMANPQRIGDLMGGLAVVGGMLCEGSALSWTIFVAYMLVPVGLVWVEINAMARGFAGIATRKNNARKKAYRSDMIRTRTVRKALMWREHFHLRETSIYMLNSCLGTFMMVVMAVVAVVKGRELAQLAGILPSLTGLILCGASCMNMVTAPSVSLEGRNMWIIQSMPVDPWKVLWSKLRLHNQLTLIPMALLFAALVYAFRPSFAICATSAVLGVAYTVLEGLFGLFMDVRHGSLHWTSEQFAVKQSFSVFVCTMSDMVGAIALIGGYFLLKQPNAVIYNLAAIAVIVIVDFLLAGYLTTKGVRKFEYFS